MCWRTAMSKVYRYRGLSVIGVTNTNTQGDVHIRLGMPCTYIGVSIDLSAIGRIKLGSDHRPTVILLYRPNHQIISN